MVRRYQIFAFVWRLSRATHLTVSQAQIVGKIRPWYGASLPDLRFYLEIVDRDAPYSMR